LSRFIFLNEELTEDTSPEPVREASVPGTNLGASFAGRLVFTSEFEFTGSCTEERGTVLRETVVKPVALKEVVVL
jgi:hypothetical protein